MDTSVHGQFMTNGSIPTTFTLSPKHTTVIGCWNVRTLYETGRLSQVINEMIQCKIDILGISESHWTVSGHITHNSGAVIYYSGKEDGNHQAGVAVIMSKAASKALME